ncbi:unnamed protein product [Ectocarpus sp. 12 AP-2014]
MSAAAMNREVGGLRSSSSLLAIVTATSPTSHLSPHPLRGPVPATSKNKNWTACNFEFSSRANGCLVETNGSGHSSCSSRPVTSALRAEHAVRGGCARGKRRGRHRPANRRLASFLAPALVWIFAFEVEYFLWWRGGCAAPIKRQSWCTVPAPGGVANVAHANGGHFVCFHVLLCLALLSHVAATVTDPGFFSRESHLLGRAQERGSGRWCSHCEAYKPPRAHHCRRCGACVARMDHHCAFVANCVGAGNHKQMLLFLLYSAACAVHAAFLFCRLCNASLMAVLLVGIFSWLVCLMSSQVQGIRVHAGTVDRMQAAAPGYRAAGPAGALSAAPPDPRRQDGWPGLLPTGRESPPGHLQLPDDGRVTPALDGDVSSSTGQDLTQGARRPAFASSGGFEVAVSLPRASPGAVAGDAASGGLGLRFRVIRGLWETVHQEILGEGTWVLWFVPTPARLSPEVEQRVYAPHGKAGRAQ